MATTLSTPLISALEHAWQAIQAQHPDTPDAVVIIGSGSDPRRQELRLGHFAADRWRQADERLPEVFIGGEGLQRGAPDVLATLLHEAAHGVADVRDIKDTSRQGRYHNRRYKALGEELGLEITQAPGIGWSATRLPPTTAERYATTITALEQALTLYRQAETATAPPAQKTTPACVCQCQRRIRVSPSVLAAGPITCGVCHTDFEPDVTDDEDPNPPAPHAPSDPDWGPDAPASLDR